MIKSIVFDIGGIVVKEYATKNREILANKFKFSNEKFSEFAKKNIEKAYKGDNSFFVDLVNELKLDIKPDKLAKEWLKLRNKNSKIDKQVRNLILKLKKNYCVVCLTNTTNLNDRAVARKEAYKLFDLNIISTQAKAMKPEQEIYKLLLNKLKEMKIKSEEIIFIDNKQEYLAAAEKLGINVILYTKYYKLVNDLIKFGVVFKK